MKTGKCDTFPTKIMLGLQLYDKQWFVEVEQIKVKKNKNNIYKYILHNIPFILSLSGLT